MRFLDEMVTYLLDSNVVLELLRNRVEAVTWLNGISPDSEIFISGWTIIEFMKEKNSKQEMTDVQSKLQQYQIAWPRPENCNEVPIILINHFHSQRDKDKKLKGSAIYDTLIYVTAKSYGLTLVTMDTDFNFVKDIPLKTLNST